jgi:peptide/nickel transport system ATP-binding protein
MAIANNPKVIIADEPTTALDVTVQAQVLGVLGVARCETGAAMIMITHDLGVVAGTADTCTWPSPRTSARAASRRPRHPLERGTPTSGLRVISADVACPSRPIPESETT